MTRKKLRQYLALKKEIVRLDRKIEELREQMGDVPTVLGKVTASSHDFPYILTHVPVEMDEPEESAAIKERLQIKKRRKEECEMLVLEIERFIAEIPDSTDRQIFEMTFLEGKKQSEIADVVGLERSGISKRIGKYL